MKEKIIWAGYEMEWFDANDFSHLDESKIKQVYGFLLGKDNKIILVRPTEKRGWRLPGGGPEKQDKDWKDTIVREADEEADVKVDKNFLIPIGYFKIIPLSKNCENKEHFALRVVGKITKVNEQTEDVSDGLINERIFIKPEDFLKYCSWNESGRVQRDKAIESLKKLKSLEIANSLPKYFTKDALINIKKDFIDNFMIYSKDYKGFLNYRIEKNKIILLWMAVSKESQSKGIGKELIKQLEKTAKEKGISKIEVETLSPNENYKPYERVRKFYEENGFKLVKINSPKKKGWDEMGVWVKELK